MRNVVVSGEVQGDRGMRRSDAALAVGDDLACGVKPGLAEASAEAAGVQVAPGVVNEVVPGEQDRCGDVTATCRANCDAVVFGGCAP